MEILLQNKEELSSKQAERERERERVRVCLINFFYKCRELAVMGVSTVVKTNKTNGTKFYRIFFCL